VPAWFWLDAPIALQIDPCNPISSL